MKEENTDGCILFLYTEMLWFQTPLFQKQSNVEPVFNKRWFLSNQMASKDQNAIPLACRKTLIQAEVDYHWELPLGGDRSLQIGDLLDHKKTQREGGSLLKLGEAHKEWSRVYNDIDHSPCWVSSHLKLDFQTLFTFTRFCLCSCDVDVFSFRIHLCALVERMSLRI